MVNSFLCSMKSVFLVHIFVSMKSRVNYGFLDVYWVTAGVVKLTVAICGLFVYGSNDFVLSYLK